MIPVVGIWVLGRDCIVGVEDTPLQFFETDFVMLFGYILSSAYIQRIF